MTWKMIILLALMVTISGCSLMEILKPGQKVTSDPIISTPAKQMIEAVKKSNWLVMGSILGIAAGTFALLNGSKFGLPAIAACCVSLFMALAVARFATWMAVCGLIGSFAVCGASVLSRKNALVDLIRNIQDIKQTLEEDNVNGLTKDKVKEILLVQSTPTQRQVQEIKAELKLKGEI